MTDRWVIQRSHAIGTSVVANLARWARDGGEHIGRATINAPAVVIGGGPSCRGFERIPDGALVLTVNTAAPKVCAALAPDVLCIREAIDTSDQVRALRGLHLPKLAVCDIGTHPNTIDALRSLSIPMAWMLPAQGHLWWLADLLEIEPLYSGESAMTGCVSIAERIGCQSITLLGCDLAFGSDGAAYGEGTAWSGVRGSMHSGYVDLGDRGGMVEHAERSGVAGPPLREQATPVVMSDGSTGWALATWASQRLWLEQFAERRPGMVLRNLSEGAAIAGWPSGVAVSGPPGSVPTTALDTSRLDAELRRQLRHARDSASPWTAQGALEGHPLVDTIAARSHALTAAQRLPLFVALEEHARGVNGAVGEYAEILG
jgi:hypothetical protein